MKIGYLRVSTEEQNPYRQLDSLTPLCDRVYVEKLSAVAARRPVFDAVMDMLKPGDTLVVWDLDRAFRSTVDAILQEERLRTAGIRFEVFSLRVNTAEPAGEFAYSVMAAAAQYERRMISKRTKEGLEAAVKRGVKLGRKRKLSDKQVRQAREKLQSGGWTRSEVAALFGVHPRTLARALSLLGSDM
ncbi:recombinase family protein [Roseibium album]|uniref:DNA-invertase hin n=1 Tax=Roseibium album TaxID=311410 RepID=A0A0M7A9X4_9HYPH|nr:recombinase family protein [Roseibium album]CTQ58136.1 DNA-invertase hin [Roseibium album]CTQ65653.1 DNA-invertase hin [Roseibium album]CTQ70533.1 DNA-invertase hin [Roseibium album]